LSLCVDLSTSYRGQHYSYIWSGAIGLRNPDRYDGQANIYETPWSTELFYVCQGHSK